MYKICWSSLNSCITSIYLTEMHLWETHKPKNSPEAQLSSLFLYTYLSTFSFRKSKTSKGNVITVHYKTRASKAKKCSMWKIYNKSRHLTIRIDYSDNNKCGSGFSFFILDSIQFQIYFMSIQKYFCTSNHTILPKGSNFHSTCITNLLNSSVFGGAVSSGPLNYNGS